MLIRLPSLLDVTRRLGACRNGNTAIEFGLTAPLLVLLAFGAFDYGSAYVESVRLNGAARAGAQQALYNSQDWQKTDQMEQAALEEYAGRTLTPEEIALMSVSATAEAFCACTAGVTLACTATCPGGESPGQFVSVTLNNATPLTLPYPWADGDTVQVDGQAVVRVR
ncbi:MAG TPA: TadE/TadG family type IV pilus assembly protein [Geminicoccaceae bacterium]|nr:TadE/TadG family type IV pilus assembly protein [Geminicoccaceae bacterium]